jgi:hypothetical protein
MANWCRRGVHPRAANQPANGSGNVPSIAAFYGLWRPAGSGACHCGKQAMITSLKKTSLGRVEALDIVTKLGTGELVKSQSAGRSRRSGSQTAQPITQFAEAGRFVTLQLHKFPHLFGPVVLDLSWQRPTRRFDRQCTTGIDGIREDLPGTANAVLHVAVQNIPFGSWKCGKKCISITKIPSLDFFDS